MIPLDEVCSKLECSKSTAIRWIKSGCGGKRLRAFKVGKKWYTTMGDVMEFSQPPSSPKQTSTNRKKLKERFGI